MIDVERSPIDCQALRMEQWMLPAPDTVRWNHGKLEGEALSISQKIGHYALNALRMIGEIVLLPFIGVYSFVKWLANRSVSKVDLDKPPVELKKIDLASVLPDVVGYAGSGFQDSGLGTSVSATPQLPGKNQWDDFLTPEHIEGMAELKFDQFFIDILGDPESYVKMLEDSGCTGVRFSLEMALIQTESGKINPEAIAAYKNFIAHLKQAGIEPYVTLHHFVHPQWFEDLGAFYTPDNIDLYVDHCLLMIELFPEVDNWYTFNEIGAFVLENLMGDFPTKIKGDMAAAGRMMRNLLIAHCKIYEAAKDKHPSKTIGLTHQWIKMEPIKGNPLERLVCHLTTKITHWALYNFFKTGEFVFDIPGQANVRFSIPKEEFEKNNGYMDAIGFQRYGVAQIKIGMNNGQPYPGDKVKNFCWKNFGFTFGATCKEGESVMSFGPTPDPEGLRPCLQEAVALKHRIHISEIGCDAKLHKWGEKTFRIDEEMQREIMERYAPILADFQDHIDAYFVWTPYATEEMDEPGNLEWQRGAGTRLGMIKIQKDENRRIRSYTYSLAGESMKTAFNSVRNRMLMAM